MRRVFIAVKIQPSENLKNLISFLKTSMAGENIKWTDPDSIHVTLAFLGDTEEEKISLITRFLQEKFPGFGNFEFFLKGIGVFRSLSKPRIIWIGSTASERLVSLNDLVNAELEGMGFEVEERDFHPHVTIGRIKSLKNIDNLRTLIENYRETEIQKVQVDEIILYESILGGPSAVYKPVFEAKL